VGDVDALEAATAPPRTERIAGADRQPANVAEPEADAHPHPAAPAEEGHVRRRPHRAVVRRHGSGPPHPPRPVNEPAAVVVRRPSPWLIADPGPAPIGLPVPASVAVRRPAILVVRHPNLAVPRHLRPVAVVVQI